MIPFNKQAAEKCEKVSIIYYVKKTLHWNGGAAELTFI